MKNKMIFLLGVVIVFLSIFIGCNQNVNLTQEIELKVDNVDSLFAKEMVKIINDCEKDYANLKNDGQVIVNKGYYERFHYIIFKKYREKRERNELNETEGRILALVGGLVEATYKMRNEEYKLEQETHIKSYNFYRDRLYQYIE